VTAKKKASAKKADAIAQARVRPPDMGVPSHDFHRADVREQLSREWAASVEVQGNGSNVFESFA
jgi:hypothetical protein